MQYAHTHTHIINKRKKCNVVGKNQRLDGTFFVLWVYGTNG